jgi:hypothetical protein
LSPIHPPLFFFELSILQLSKSLPSRSSNRAEGYSIKFIKHGNVP